jgi:hypothetical protein
MFQHLLHLFMLSVTCNVTLFISRLTDTCGIARCCRARCRVHGEPCFRAPLLCNASRCFRARFDRSGEVAFRGVGTAAMAGGVGPAINVCCFRADAFSMLLNSGLPCSMGVLHILYIGCLLQHQLIFMQDLLYSRPARGTLREGTASACMRQVVACTVCAQMSAH